MFKINLKSLLIIAGISVLFSCTSTNALKPDNSEDINKECDIHTVEETPNEQNNFSKKEDDDFIDFLKDFEIIAVSYPKQTYSGKEFSAPYLVHAKTSKGAIPDLDITVTWPASRNNDSISYESLQIKTDKDGNASFIASVPFFAINDFVTFYPSPKNSSNSSIAKAAYEKCIKLPYRVKSSYTVHQGVLYAYDFNENGRPITNSFLLLQNLRNSGVNVGNSPISEASYFDKPVSMLYEATRVIVGDIYKFMIICSFKYDAPVVSTEEGIVCSLSADITCVDMNKGDVIYRTKISKTDSADTKAAAEKKCRKFLAEKASEAIIYGM